MTFRGSEESFVARLRELTGGVDSPIGDDCAVLETVSPTLLATVDCMASNVHFSPDATPDDLARKLVGINVSDVAAMGGEPRWALLSAARCSLTDEPVFEQRLVEHLGDAGVQLVGGDTSGMADDDEAVYSLTVLGSASGDHVMRRNGASPGDYLVVSGTLGLVRALLADATSVSADAKNRLYNPPNRVDLGQAAVKAGVRAAIDVSDGLIKDLKRLLTASGVGGRLDPGEVPIDPEVKSLAEDHAQALQWALDGGEDFELLLAVSPDRVDSIETDVPLTTIGTVTERDGIAWDPALPEDVNLDAPGYDHFD